MDKLYFILILVVGVSFIKGYFEKESLFSLISGLLLCCVVVYMVFNPDSFIELGSFCYNSLFDLVRSDSSVGVLKELGL